MLFHAKHTVKNSLWLWEGYLMTYVNLKYIWGKLFEDNNISHSVANLWAVEQEDFRFQDSQHQSNFLHVKT